MKKNQDSDDTVSEHCVGMFWARLDFMAPTTPGENALKADVRAKQWARLVAKKPASPKKVTSLAQKGHQPRPSDQPSSSRRPTAPEEPANRVRRNSQPRPKNQPTAPRPMGCTGSGCTARRGGNSLKKTARSLKNAALRRAKAICGRVFGYLWCRNNKCVTKNLRL